MCRSASAVTCNGIKARWPAGLALMSIPRSGRLNGDGVDGARRLLQVHDEIVAVEAAPRAGDWLVAHRAGGLEGGVTNGHNRVTVCGRSHADVAVVSVISYSRWIAPAAIERSDTCAYPRQLPSPRRWSAWCWPCAARRFMATRWSICARDRHRSESKAACRTSRASLAGLDALKARNYVNGVTIFDGPSRRLARRRRGKTTPPSEAEPPSMPLPV